MTAQPPKPLKPQAPIDGRRLRSETSRLRIVEAMIALVSESPTMPPAEAVATRAGVGLRTVFRLFEDMDGLYRGMQAVMTERLGGLLEGPIVAPDWRLAIDILIEGFAFPFGRPVFEAALVDTTEQAANLRKLLAALERGIETDRKRHAATTRPS